MAIVATEWKVFYDGALVAFDVGVGAAITLPGRLAADDIHLYDAADAEVPFMARLRQFVRATDGADAYTGELDPVDDALLLVRAPDGADSWVRLSPNAVVTIDRKELEVVPLPPGALVTRGVCFDTAIAWAAGVTADVPALDRTENVATTNVYALLRLAMPRADRHAPTAVVLVAAYHGVRGILMHEQAFTAAAPRAVPDTSAAELLYRLDALALSGWRETMPDVARILLQSASERVALFVGITVDAGAQLMARSIDPAAMSLALPPNATERVSVGGNEIGGGRLRRDRRGGAGQPRYILFGNYLHRDVVVRRLVRLYSPRHERQGLEYDIGVDESCAYEVRLITGENWGGAFAPMDDSWFGRIIAAPGEATTLRDAE